MDKLKQMSELDLYSLYNTLDSLKTLNSDVADLIYTSLMQENKSVVIALMQQAIVYEVAARIQLEEAN